MALPGLKAKITGDTYSANKRYKVGTPVEYLGSVFQNLTGINSLPSIASSNWLLVSSAGVDTRPIVLVFGNTFFLVKHPTNNDPANKSIIQNNDWICDGFFDDTRFWYKAICINDTPATINNEVSWNLIDEIDEIVLV